MKYISGWHRNLCPCRKCGRLRKAVARRQEAPEMVVEFSGDLTREQGTEITERIRTLGKRNLL